MRCLIVEDDDYKRAKLVDCVLAVDPTVEIAQARSYQAGLRALRKNGTFNLVVLDMALTTFDVGPSEDGGRPAAFAGRDLLDYMKRLSPMPWAVVVTQYDRFGDDNESLTFEQLDGVLKESYGSAYLGTVAYSVSYEGWKAKVSDVVKGVIRNVFEDNG